MSLINSTDIAGGLVNAFEQLPELTEHEKSVIIHEMALMIKATDWPFDENEFAEKILNPRGLQYAGCI